MTLGPVVEWLAFAILSAIAIAGALGMTTTMGMFRSAILLMASFLGVAGLFVLLSADLLAWLTVMMYVGGMLVMALFMALMSHDPGGDMMAGMMKLAGLERAFSAGLAAPGGGGEHGDAGKHDGKHEGEGGERAGRARGPGGGARHGGDRAEHATGEHGSHSSSEDMRGGGDHGSGMHHGAGDGGAMGDMAMFTPLKRWAAALAGAVAVLLVGLVLTRPTFPAIAEAPDPASARQVGLLLMGKYMLAFETAGLLILLGVFGGVWAARASASPDPTDRARLRAAVDAPPTGVVEPPLTPLAPGAPAHGGAGEPGHGRGAGDHP